MILIEIIIYCSNFYIKGQFFESKYERSIFGLSRFEIDNLFVEVKQFNSGKDIDIRNIFPLTLFNLKNYLPLRLTGEIFRLSCTQLNRYLESGTKMLYQWANNLYARKEPKKTITVGVNKIVMIIDVSEQCFARPCSKLNEHKCTPANT